MADVLTHYTLGKLAAVKLDRRSEFAVVIGSIAPDVVSKSMILMFSSQRFYDIMSHSLVGSYLYSLLFALVFVRTSQHRFALLMYAGCCLHIAVDVFKDYLDFGAVYPLAPFILQPLEISLYNPFDTVYLAPLNAMTLLFIGLSRRRSASSQTQETRQVEKAQVSDLSGVAGGWKRLVTPDVSVIFLAATFVVYGTLYTKKMKHDFSDPLHVLVAPSVHNNHPCFFDDVETESSQLFKDDGRAVAGGREPHTEWRHTCEYKGKNVHITSASELPKRSKVKARFDSSGERPAYKVEAAMSYSYYAIAGYACVAFLFAFTFLRRGWFSDMLKYLLLPHAAVIAMRYFWGSPQIMPAFCTTIPAVLLLTACVWAASRFRTGDLYYAVGSICVNAVLFHYLDVRFYLV